MTISDSPLHKRKFNWIQTHLIFDVGIHLLLIQKYRTLVFINYSFCILDKNSPPQDGRSINLGRGVLS